MPAIPHRASSVAALVSSLKHFGPPEVGSTSWWIQRRTLERLNSCAHTPGDSADAVTATFALAPQLLDVCVQELLVIEAWRERVLPRLLGACRTTVSTHSIYTDSRRSCAQQRKRRATLPSCASIGRATTRRSSPTCWRRCSRTTPVHRPRLTTRCSSLPTLAFGRYGLVSVKNAGQRWSWTSHTAPLSSFSLPSQLLYLTTVKHSDRSADACVPHTTTPSKLV